jgi:hypothetical protein
MQSQHPALPSGLLHHGEHKKGVKNPRFSVHVLADGWSSPSSLQSVSDTAPSELKLARKSVAMRGQLM